MAKVKKISGKTVFGLDIGTRSIVGTVGYKKGDEFYCLAQRIKEHETRSMLDGQIHDIGLVSETITEVKEELEKEMANVREVIKTDELEAITDAVDSLQKLSNGIFTKLYESGAATEGASADAGDDVVVEDAEVVDDNNN